MPQNQLQRMIFAFLTVIVTVHAFVFYSLYVVNGNSLMTINNASSVLEAISIQGGVYTLGHYIPIWGVVVIEFILAYSLEILMGSPCSFKLAVRVFNPRETHPVMFESAIICATVGIMCPAMSLIASILYYPYYDGFSVVTLIANWIKLVCFNFPFAFFSQMFFIQPLIRTVFKTFFARNMHKSIEENVQEVSVDAAQGHTGIASAIKKDAYCISVHGSVLDALRCMTEKKTGGIPVLNDDGSVAGFISDGDIVRFMFGDDEDHFDSASMYPLLYNASALDDRLSNLADVSVMKLANEDVVSVNVDDDVSDFFKVIADNRIKKVPVLDNGKMVGVASKSDLFREMMKKSSYIGENKDSM